MGVVEVVVTSLGDMALATEAFGRVTVDVPRERWVEALTAARDAAGCAYLDWLTAVDELPAGIALVAHVWCVGRREGVLLRTLLPPEDPAIASATAVYAGAAWHERETYEMFGVVFDGHPGLVPLLLPDGFEGRPLRKEFVLASRAVRPWPGAKEPGDGEGGSPARRRLAPPGVPAASTWGARPGSDP